MSATAHRQREARRADPVPGGRWGTPVRLGPFAGERYGSDVRWLCVDASEVVRRVALVVRDAKWRTPDPTSTRVLRTADALVISGTTPLDGAAIDWSLRFAADDAGLEVVATLTPRRDVAVNRAGLVVLLDARRWSGARFVATHRSAARTSRGRLPLAIAPHQPLLDLASVRLAARDGRVLDLAFAGDVFEMEDQRNWLDPTFKLYNRALALPIPYTLAGGATVEQRIHIRTHAGPRRAMAPRRQRARGVVPALGLATAPSRVPGAPARVRSVRALGAAFVYHRTSGTTEDLGRASRFAAGLGVPLHVEAIGPAARAADAIAGARPDVIALHLAGDGETEAMRRRLPHAELAGGTFSDFVLMNRNGLPGWSQRATFALCPTVHARDDRSLVETLAALPDVFAQARRIAGMRPVAAGPCSLRRRLVPRTGAPNDAKVRGVPEDVDPRQHEPIAAAWLATAVALAAAAGIASFCAFEASGARGLLADAGTPASRVFAALAVARNAPLHLLGVDPSRGAAFVVGRAGPKLWLVELSGAARDVPSLRDATPLVGVVRRGRLSPYGILVAPFAARDRTAATNWIGAAR